MTFDELFDQGVRRVRLPNWNPYAYLELRESSSLPGVMTPFARLFDIGCNGRDVGVWEVDGEQWEEWHAPSDWEQRQDIYTRSLDR